MQPVVHDRFGGFAGLIPVALNHARSPDQDFAFIREFDVDARDGSADAADTATRLGIGGRDRRAFRLSVDLVHGPVECPIPLDEVRCDRRGSRGQPPAPVDPQQPAHVPEDKQIGDEAQYRQTPRQRLPALAKFGGAPPDRQGAVVGEPPQRCRLFEFDRDGRVLLLPHARDREMNGRRYFLLVLYRRFQAFHDVDGRARLHRGEGVEHSPGDVSERQKTELLIAPVHRQCFTQQVHLVNHVAVTDHRALRSARGSRRIGHDHQVLGFGRANFTLPALGMVREPGPPHVKQLLDADALLVVETPQPFHVEDDDLLKRRRGFPDFEHLVQLLLVFGEVEARTAVGDQVLDLVGTVGGVDSVGDTACTDDSEIREQPFPVDFRRNGADIAALKPQRLQSESDQTGLLAVVPPRVLVPDAEVLFANGHPVGLRDDAMPEQPGNRTKTLDRGEIPAVVGHQRQVFLCFQRRRPRTP